jgi:hypothetical protein
MKQVNNDGMHEAEIKNVIKSETSQENAADSCGTRNVQGEENKLNQCDATGVPRATSGPR